MGEIIRKVGTFHIGKTELDVELNKSPTSSGERTIHIQNEKFRLEVREQEFVQLASCVLLAKKQFAILKGMEDEK